VTHPEVVVAGDATLDVHVSPMRPVAAGSDVPADVRMRPGGQGANLAVRLARQGVGVTLVCALADDPAGDVIRAALAADGVTLAALPAEATGVIVVLGGEDGERSMLSHRAVLSPLAADAAAGRSTGWLVVSGYPLLQPDALRLAGRLAALPMRRVLVGCAVANDALAAWLAAARELRPDLVIANRDEAETAHLDELGAALAITDASGAEVRIGAARASAATTGGSAAVDTTGAGDAFAARLVAGLLDAGWPPDEVQLQAAVTGAVELASAVARVRGAQAEVVGERPVTLRR
jgi:sugar/nucleoside kinase (ribokinase family)